MDLAIQEMLRRAEDLRNVYRGKDDRFTMGIPDHGSLLKVLIGYCREKGLLKADNEPRMYGQEVLSILAERAAFIFEVILESRQIGSVLSLPDSEKSCMTESLEMELKPTEMPRIIRKYLEETSV